MTTHAISINPYTQEQIFKHPYLLPENLSSIAQNSKQGAAQWQEISLEEKAIYIKKIAAAIADQIHDYALLATQEMGKPIQQSIAELEKCIVALNYYAENAATFLNPQAVSTQHTYSHIHFEPLGTVLAVMPWNFPYWQVFRAMGPILMGGNAMILKHASNVSQCALAIDAITQKAGLPEGLFQTVILQGKHVEQLIAQPEIQAVTFTGSTEVGKQIAQSAAKHLKKQVLELGGSDAYIVCEDADLEHAAHVLVQSRLNNCGQSCIGAKRFIVLDSIQDEFLALVAAEMDMYKPLNPEDDASKLGTLYSLAAKKELHEQVTTAINAGAKLYKGGNPNDENSAFYPPTILTHITKDNPAYTQEFFGPVALVLTAATIEEAIFLANDTPFGLGGGIFSGATIAAQDIAIKKIKSGSVAVNGCVSSDPRMPFGGIKESGYGRELHQFGMMEFVNIKSVVRP